ncbi:MAG: hypothetical protein LDL53_02850 [Candidatus Hydrogenedens sp.]|nr:hypothetical protein [Candidatus Hydrogenedens sp.]
MSGKISMNNDCEKYREQLYYGIISEEINEIFYSEHIDKCAECKNFVEKIKEMQNNLITIGENLQKTLPKIDIKETIFTEISKVKNGEQVIRNAIDKEDVIPEFVEWNLYIEEEVNDVSRYRCELKLEHSLLLRDEIEQICQIHQSLNNIGSTWEAPVLDTDLLPSILEKINHYKEKQEEKIKSIEKLEEELFELSSAITPALNDVDISAQVAKKIKGKDYLTKNKEKPKIFKLKSNITSNRNEKSKDKTATKHASYNYVIPLAIAAVLVLTLLGVFINFSLNQDLTNRQIDTATNSNIKENNTIRNDTYKTTQPFYQIDSESNSQNKQIAIKMDNGKSTHRKNYVEGALSVWTNQLKENALANAGKLMRMGVWATLSPEEARELLQQSGLSPEAVLGAVQFLPPDEARVVLQAAIDNNPNDAYLRYAMVQTLMKLDNVSNDDIYNHLTEWSQLDPSNALPHFIEAELYMKNGLPDKAINCITDANSATNYNSYSTITAKAYMEALLAKGVDPEMAKLLASASLGLRESQDLENMVQTLLDYGKYYEDIGDYETALLIYEALKNLGVKIDTSSTLIQERMAGLEYAQKAVNAMLRILSSTNTLSDTQSLIDFTQTLNEMMTNYNLALNNFYKLFDTDNPALILDVLNTYLTNGNVTIKSTNQQ